jgi:hypothetical protein
MQQIHNQTKSYIVKVFVIWIYAVMIATPEQYVLVPYVVKENKTLLSTTIMVESHNF